MLMNFLLLFSSISIGLTNSNWLVVMLMVEFGLFMVVFMSSNYLSLYSMRSVFKYFFVQSVSGLVLLVSGISVFMLNSPSVCSEIFLLSAILLKLGIFPMYFWVLPVYSESNYMILGVVGFMAKILPLYIYNFYVSLGPSKVMQIMSFFAVSSIAMGAWLGLPAKNYRTFLGASSVAHSGWFILASHSSSILFYFWCYGLSFLLLLMMMQMDHKIMMALNTLALGGLPPFSVFLGKLWVIYSWVENSMPLVVIMMALLFSVVSLFYYLKFSFQMMFSSSNSTFGFISFSLVLNFTSVFFFWM
uniref:NADH dehydrogenase subunit 2 n=1 Tax=Monacha cartusiana TaxID=225461 RepID=UPI0023D83688|nr:NADH dehydrogenase subunit 2 [Monacha cartusiana]URP31093.1 NADH dehydrogenase subunit 2 [Monacha cartusiana]